MVAGVPSNSGRPDIDPKEFRASWVALVYLRAPFNTKPKARSTQIDPFNQPDGLVPTCSCLTLLHILYNFIHVILTFGNALAEDLFHDRISRVVRQFPPGLRANARRKLQMLDDADTLQVLMALPSNRLEKLKGDRKGHYSIRINLQWRVVFQWRDSNALNVSIEDYH